MEDHNFRNNNIIISKSRTMGVSLYALVDNDEYCTNMHIHNNETSNHDLETPEHYDTLTQSDIVRNQYMTLPYPAISQGKLKNEKTYYDKKYKTGIRKIPYTINRSILLEALNHFLYKGRNTFRLAFKWYLKNYIFYHFPRKLNNEFCNFMYIFLKLYCCMIFMMLL